MNSYSMNIGEYYHKCTMQGIPVSPKLSEFAKDPDASVMQITESMVAVVFEVEKVVNSYARTKRYRMDTVQGDDVQQIAESDSKSELIGLYGDFITKNLVNASRSDMNHPSKLRRVAADSLKKQQEQSEC